MSEPKFRVGDMVRCVEADGRLKLGRVYTVCALDEPYCDWPVLAEESRGATGEGWWHPDRFELVPDDDNQFRVRSKYDATKEVFRDITLERDRQDAKFGPHGNLGNMLPFQRLSVLTEEVGELAQALNDAYAANTEYHLGARLAHARDELVQVAAVAVAWLELLEERGTNA